MTPFFAKSGPLLCAIGCGLTATSALAEAPQLRVTALGGLERTDSAPGTGAVDGAFYGGQIGADWKLGALLVGVEADLGDSTAKAAIPGNLARQGLFGSAAVRVALPLGDRARVFVRGGYAYHEVNYTTGPAFKGSGYTLGGGAEFDLSGPLFLRGEYRFNNYGQTVRGQQFLGGLGLRF